MKYITEKTGSGGWVFRNWVQPAGWKGRDGWKGWIGLGWLKIGMGCAGMRRKEIKPRLFLSEAAPAAHGSTASD
jgi:hypothetical protein